MLTVHLEVAEARNRCGERLYTDQLKAKTSYALGHKKSMQRYPYSRRLPRIVLKSKYIR